MNRKSPAVLRKAGFTLMELMVVVVLIGIMSAMIIPEFRGTYENALLRSASRQLISAVNLAYSRSVSSNQPHRLRLDPTAGEYVIERKRSGSKSEFVSLEGVIGAKGKLDGRVTIVIQEPELAGANLDAQPSGPADLMEDQPKASELPPDEITFYPDGTADRREIVLRDRDGFGLTLRVNPVTSRVRIVEMARR